jgi:Domain of unknown function (DUF4382)
MSHRTMKLSLAIAMAAVPLAACDTNTGMTTPGHLNVYMAQSAGAGAVAGALSAADVADGSLSLSAVDSLVVVLNGIDVLPSSGNDQQDSGWVSLGLADDTLDLLALPDSDAPATLTVASGTLPAGSYSMIRLRYSDAWIVLGQEVSAGGGTYGPGHYDLTVPSGDQTGIKVQVANLTVADGGTSSVTLFFDAANTTAHLVLTGNGRFMMSPVLHSRPGKP